jgi:penicillin-binding protein 1C
VAQHTLNTILIMKSFIKLLSITLVILVVSMGAIIYLWPAPPLLTGISYSRAAFDSNQHLLRLTLSDDEQYRLFTPITELSDQLVDATLLQEDQYFYWHPGINPISLLRASWQTYILKSRRMGASTITMQVARMRYRINSKTASGKLWQIIRALQLEAHYSKQQILEAYLNFAPYGNNIEGVGAASLIYFNKPALDLSLPELLTLTVIPQNPGKRLPSQQLLKIARDKLYTRWQALHPDDRKHQALMHLPLQMRSIRHTPFLAPHLVNDLLATNNDSRLITTLDIKLQQSIEHMTNHYIARKSRLGVHNAVVMLVDTRTMETKALLGSNNFYDPSIQGQVNGTKAKRSPGSALKPFIYALALDQGLIHPDTVLKDVPRSFGHYNPENFDNDFAGPIKAKDALTLSRNIPAIYLAEQLKHPSLYEFLQLSQVSNLKSEDYYGLALVLGGAEVSMQELVGMYATLLNEGLWHPIRFTKNQTPVAGKRLLSPEASYLVLEMLMDSPRPNGMQNITDNKELPIAWKTGTSSGYRDAWAVGTVGPYVLAVWIGNFNNEGNPAFIGKEMAAPLFLEIAALLNTQQNLSFNLSARSNHLNLTKVDVCKASGMLPTRHCPETEKVWFIPGKSPIKVDTIHREIAIDMKTGLRACEFSNTTRFEVFEFWSSDILAIYKRAGMQRRTPPPYDVNCQLLSKSTEGLAPQIISPQTQVKYVTRVTDSKESTLPLTAVVDADVKHLYWFINANFIGETTRDKPFYWRAVPGRFVIRVVDDYGRADARDVEILQL